MEHPDDLRYTSAHEWVRIDGAEATVGITDFAQDSLGDVVFVELPDVGRTVAAGESVCEIESTKSVSEIYAPLAGTVAAVNDALEDDPGLVNSAPYADGWIFRLSFEGQPDGGALLDAASYVASLEG